jgi:hypothetical protein
MVKNSPTHIKPTAVNSAPPTKKRVTWPGVICAGFEATTDGTGVFCGAALVV